MLLIYNRAPESNFGSGLRFCHGDLRDAGAAASFSFSSMSSRSAYTAITPEYAKFPTLHSSISTDLNSSTSRLQSEEPEASSLSVNEERGISSRIHSWLALAKDVVQRNTGLLLFITSQIFLTFMNLAVKILNTIDPPITAFEVCLLSYFLNRSIWWYLAYKHSNGTQKYPYRFRVWWNEFTQIITYLCCVTYM